jgi:LacI family transcriptional regulator
VTRPHRRRSPTITDVARLADVSITTVSFVLNEAADRSIADETRRRVRAAAEHLGYRPNAAAKLLRTHRSHTIGFVADEVASTPFAGDIIRGARETAWKHGKVLIVVDTGYDSAVAASAVDVMLERRIEGLIVAAKYHRPLAPPPTAGEVPTVLVDCVAVDRSLPSVVPDELGGGRTATEALIRKGHRRIGFINLGPGIPASTGRLDGYAAALRDHGLPFNQALVRYTDSEVPGRGYRCALDLLDLSDPPTGIFCGNDRTAMEVYEAVKGRGLRIPEDVAIVGFDDMRIIAAHLNPPLSTVALPHHEMGRWAVEYLIRHPEPGGQPVQHLMPCPYVARASV